MYRSVCIISVGVKDVVWDKRRRMGEGWILTPMEPGPHGR